jgi:hypothetical protein
VLQLFEQFEMKSASFAAPCDLQVVLEVFEQSKPHIMFY